MYVLANLDIGFANLQLAVEDDIPEGDSHEVTVSLVSKENGTFIQDLIMLRPNPIKRNIQLLIWADETDESYTDKFDIGLYEEPEE